MHKKCKSKEFCSQTCIRAIILSYYMYVLSNNFFRKLARSTLLVLRSSLFPGCIPMILFLLILCKIRLSLSPFKDLGVFVNIFCTMFKTVSSRLSPCRHPTFIDALIIRTAAKFTKINSRYYRLANEDTNSRFLQCPL